MTGRIIRLIESSEDLQRLGQDETPIAATLELAELLERRSVKGAYIGSYRTRQDSFRAATEDYAACFDAWGRATTADGIPLRDLFTHDGQSVWDMVEPDFHWVFLYVLDEWRLAGRVLDATTPREVRLSRSTRLGEVFAVACRTRGVLVTTAPDAERFKRHKTEAGGAWIARLPWAIVGLLHTARSLRWRLSSRRAPKRGPFDVLYFAMGRDSGIGANGLRRIVDLASPRGERIAVVDWRFSKASRQVSTDTPMLGFERYISIKALTRTWKARWRFAGAARKMRATELRWQTADAPGRALFEAWQPEVEGIIRWCMPAAVEAYETMRHLVRSTGAMVVVMADKHERATRAMALACRREGVVSIGLPGRAGEYMDRDKTGAPIQLVDWKLVDGEAMRDWLIEEGCQPDRVIVTGNPYSDNPGVAIDVTRVDLCARLQLDPARPVVTLITSPTIEINRPEDKRAFVRGVVAAAAALDDVQLIVKLHPAERETMEEEELAKAGIPTSRFRIIQQVPLREVLTASDVTIFSNSTAGHEAVALERDLIQVNLSRSEGDVIRCAEMGAAIPAYTESAIAPAIKAILADPAVRERLSEGRRRYVGRYMCAVDGQATGRIVSAIQRIATDRPSSSACVSVLVGASHT